MDREPDAWALICSAHLIAECCTEKLVLKADDRQAAQAEKAAAPKKGTCAFMQRPTKVQTIRQIKAIAVRIWWLRPATIQADAM